MKLIRGKYRSRKSYKKATGNSLKSSGRYYKHRIQTDSLGNRFVNLAGRLGKQMKHMLSHGVR